jgi:hypothetical protein
VASILLRPRRLNLGTVVRATIHAEPEPVTLDLGRTALIVIDIWHRVLGL